jgi:methionine-S-sulfoxide reductase
VTFDSEKISYQSLVEAFFNLHNPTTRNRQGPDIGSQYRSAIFYHDDGQRKIAQDIVRKLDESGKFRSPIVTEILPAGDFYQAEDYHQRYYEKQGFHRV